MGYYIPLSLTKSSYIKYLIKQYNEIGFKEFDMTELGQFSKKDWQNKIYPIPQGYMRNVHMFSNKLVRIPEDELIKNRILNKKTI